MASKREKEKAANEQVRQQLEDMLLGGDQISDAELSTKPIANDDGDGALDKVQHPETKNMNFYDEKGNIEAKSKKLLKSVIGFYLDSKMIKKNEYIKYKKAVDEMTLSNIIFSLKTTQHAIIKLMEEIDMGNLHPRIFEVLAQLQNQMMGIVKHQAAYMITLEEGYKKIKQDQDQVDFYKKEDEEASDEPQQIGEGGALKTRGTKNMLASLKNKIESAEDVEFDEPRIRLTDPNNRPDNPDPGSADIAPPDEFDLDEDMF